MAHRDLGQPGALLGGVDRDEPVHLTVQADALQHLAAIGLQGAAIVVQAHAADPRDQPVGRQGGQPPRQRVVLAVLPPARDHVETLIQGLQQDGHVGGVVLQVGVQRHHDLARAASKPACMAAVCPKLRASRSTRSQGREVEACRSNAADGSVLPSSTMIISGRKPLETSSGISSSMASRSSGSDSASLNAEATRLTERASLILTSCGRSGALSCTRCGSGGKTGAASRPRPAGGSARSGWPWSGNRRCRSPRSGGPPRR